MRVTVENGRYTVVQGEGGGLRALRHGKEWRDCTGDGLIFALAAEVDNFREIIAALLAGLVDLAPTEALNEAFTKEELDGMVVELEKAGDGILSDGLTVKGYILKAVDAIKEVK